MLLFALVRALPLSRGDRRFPVDQEEQYRGGWDWLPERHLPKSLLSTTILALVLNAGGGSAERMYVQNNYWLFTLDPATGAVIDSQRLTPLVAYQGLVYDEGQLLFLDQPPGVIRNRLSRLNPATGRAQEVGFLGYIFGQPASLTKDPKTGRLGSRSGPRSPSATASTTWTSRQAASPYSVTSTWA